MIKKYSKIILLTLLLFFVFITTVNAKEVTLDELAQEIKELEPNATYVYVIGEYAFTSTHILTTQDTMLAARSIKVSENSGYTNDDPIYNEMTIGYFECTFDNAWNINGLEYVSNVVGTTAVKDTYEIRYIDHEGAFTKIAVSDLVEDAYITIDEVAANDKFEVSMEDGTITVTLLDLGMNSIEALAGTGIATAAEELLNEYGVKSVTLSAAGAEVKVTAENLMEKLGELEELFLALAGSENATVKDLVEKSLQITVELEDGITTEDETTFTVEFDQKEVYVNELVEEAYTTIDEVASNDKFEVALENETITVTVLENNMNSVEALKGTGIATAAQNLLDSYGIAAVTLSVAGAEVTVTAENLMEKLGDLEDLFVALAGNENATAGDLAGKSLNLKVALKEGYTTADETTFTVAFEKTAVEVSELVEEAYTTIDEVASNDKFEVALEDETITVTVLETGMASVEALRGTGIATAAEKLLNEYGVKSAILAIPGTTAKVEVTVDNLMEKLGELEELFVALAGSETATAGDLAGKSLTITVELEEGMSAIGETMFTVAFEKKEVEVSELVEEAYTTIKEVSSNEKFAVALKDETVTVTVLDDAMNSVEALRGTGIATAAENLLNEYGVEKVTIAIPGTTAKVEVTAENLMEKLGDLEDLFVALAGKENATAADLATKRLSVTIGLKTGVTTVDETAFTVIFDNKELVKVDDLVNDVYTTIDTSTENDKFEVAKGEDGSINVTMLEPGMNSVMALQGTGIAGAAQDLLNEEGVGVVTIAIPGTTAKVDITSADLMEKLGLLDELFVALAGKEDATAADLAGKSLSVTIGLKEGYLATKDTTFTVIFA